MKYKVEVNASIIYRTEVDAIDEGDAVEWAILSLEDVIGDDIDNFMIHKTKILEREEEDEKSN